MKEPVLLYEHLITKEGREYLESSGYKFNGKDMEMYILPKSWKGRFDGLAELLKQFMDNSNLGKRLGMEESFAIEIHRLLSSICYLMNSSSYKDEKYYDFDKTEIDLKLRRNK